MERWRWFGMRRRQRSDGSRQEEQQRIVTADSIKVAPRKHLGRAEQGPGRVQAGARLASVSPPHTTIRVICLIFQKWRQNCCGSHDRLPATGPGPENTACTFTDRTRYHAYSHSHRSHYFLSFSPSSMSGLSGRKSDWLGGGGGGVSKSGGARLTS